ncbi:MAG: hypothetical protein CMJ48_06415 [Planctomycetaceae bacterium]|nr:hypothetical protein [Planctomycetaceae bacterium]
MSPRLLKVRGQLMLGAPCICPQVVGFRSLAFRSGELKTKRHILKFAGLVISVSLLMLLVHLARQADPKAFANLIKQPKQWWCLAIGVGLTLAAVLITFVRWYFLVRALRLPFTLRDAFRLGFFGYCGNFVSLGSVGGDLFKALHIAHDQPGRRAEAVATVFVDRVIGLYALFVVSTIAIVATGLYTTRDANIALICWGAFIATGVGAAGIAALLIPGLTSIRLSQRLTAIPKIGPIIGPIIGKLIDAVRIYRSRLDVIALAGVMSLVVHSTLAVAFYFIARGLPGAAPELAAHFVIVPLGMLTGALPLPGAGLGALETAVDYLYVHLPLVAVNVPRGFGLVVCLVYRLITIGIAAIGAWFYIGVKREVIHEIEDAEKAASQ